MRHAGLDLHSAGYKYLDPSCRQTEPAYKLMYDGAALIDESMKLMQAGRLRWDRIVRDIFGRDVMIIWMDRGCLVRDSMYIWK